jgi:hypothetical protein
MGSDSSFVAIGSKVVFEIRSKKMAINLISNSMNHLPKVLQNEIWEYVHGDCAHFKLGHRACMVELDSVLVWCGPKSHLAREQRNMRKRKWCDRTVGGRRIQISWQKNLYWEVLVYDYASRSSATTNHPYHDGARREFYSQVRKSAMEAAKNPEYRL